MYDLPFGTHRFFIEHLTERPHMKKTLIKRYLTFIQSIEKSPKKSLQLLLNIGRNDVRSVTGSNLRNIMLLCGKNLETDVGPLDASHIQYHEPSEDDLWKLDILDELIDAQHGDIYIPGFNAGELEKMRDDICTI